MKPIDLRGYPKNIQAAAHKMYKRLDNLKVAIRNISENKLELRMLAEKAARNGQISLEQRDEVLDLNHKGLALEVINGDFSKYSSFIFDEVQQ